MSGGSLPTITGTYIGTGVALEITTPGFRPKRVELVNMTTASYGIHTDKMADGTGLTIAAAAVVAGADFVTLTDEGFIVGTDASINSVGEQVQFVAIG